MPRHIADIIISFLECAFEAIHVFFVLEENLIFNAEINQAFNELSVYTSSFQF